MPPFSDWPFIVSGTSTLSGLAASCERAKFKFEAKKGVENAFFGSKFDF
jgi:hypothetical protein